MSKKEQSETLPQITISFGDVFVAQGSRKRYIILDTGQDDWCEAAQIVKVQQMEAVSLPGTMYRDYILQITEHWDLDRILEAAMRYYGDSESKGGIYDGIRKNANQESRQMT